MTVQMVVDNRYNQIVVSEIMRGILGCNAMALLRGPKVLYSVATCFFTPFLKLMNLASPRWGAMSSTIRWACYKASGIMVDRKALSASTQACPPRRLTPWLRLGCFFRRTTSIDWATSLPPYTPDPLIAARSLFPANTDGSSSLYDVAMPASRSLE
jgi:hypothetical protein